MRKFIKDFIVLTTLFVILILILANPMSILWGIALLWALGVFNVQA
ncbi:Uncharacterised protein [Serratia proteamaculans]|jgi:hypothetical protein|nr:Uncharacterised protein [Serratia proteamaculans]CAI0815079.1 Uncharacterised protein [Serratia proteamaculans]CAI1979183.1 Uncharacterised protein [Serratia proteamaculans]